MKSKIGLMVLVLGSAMALLNPVVASARDRDDDYRRDNRYGYEGSSHARREWRERERHERHEAEERWERRSRRNYRYDNGYYNNRFYNRPGYGSGYYNSQPNGYYSQPNGYYDQYGNWRQN